MAAYSLKKEVKLYIVYNDIQYNLDISSIDFSQTIAEESYNVNTIHLQKLFEASKIYKANPANFEFTIPAIKETDLKVVFNRLLDCYSFDLYIETLQDVFCITNCVITRGQFNILKNLPLSLTVGGEGSKLYRVGDYGSTGATIPGTIRTRANSRTYNRLTYLYVSINSEPYIERLNNINIELANSITWKANTVIEGCTDQSIITYPEDFTVDKKALTGSFTDNEITDVTVLSGVSLVIKAGEDSFGVVYGFDFSLPSVNIKTRISTGEVFSQVYEWNLVGNVDSLEEIIKYVTYDEGTNFAILDDLGNPILDSSSAYILENV